MEARDLAADDALPFEPAAATPLLLLKTRSQPHDPYAAHFAAPAYAPTFLPVLTHTPSAAAGAALRALLRADPPLGAYGGLVVTSQRAVEVLAAAVHEAAEERRSGGASLGDAQGWAASEKVVYVVGPATGDAAAHALQDAFPRWRVEGRDAGAGDALARHIAAHYATPPPPSNPAPAALPAAIARGRLDDESAARRAPLLFLAGEKRRATVPAALMAAGSVPAAARRVRVDELACYGTADRADFPAAFAGAVRALRARPRQRSREAPAWVVVFSPAHGGSVLRVLGWDGPGAATEASRGEKGIRVASIGPTTRDFLKEQWGFEVDVCAPRPSPEGVRQGIEDWLERRKEQESETVGQ